MENKNNDGFSYTYSAREQAEIRKIREKYSVKTEEENKMARLRRLDAKVTQKAQAFSLVFGVLGALILGLGMSLVMTDLGVTLGIQSNVTMLLGILIGVIGGIIVSLAYPIYHFLVLRERKKIAPEIIRLTDELMK